MPGTNPGPDRSTINEIIRTLGAILIALIGAGYFVNKNFTSNNEVKDDFVSTAKYNQVVADLTACQQKAGLPITHPTSGYAEPTLPKTQSSSSHTINLVELIGESQNKEVTVKFTITQNLRDNSERLILSGSIGLSNGTAYYAERGTLNDQTGQGRNGATTYMQMPKGERLNATLTLMEVPPEVSSFSSLVINADGDAITFHNVPISWK